MNGKNHKNPMLLRVLSLLMALAMVMTLVPAGVLAAGETDGTTVYLQPNANWKIDSARFAIYYWNGSGNAWTDMSDADGDGVYEGTIPAGYTNLIFCRMNPGASANEWNNKWNQTADLTLPTDGTNCYTVAEGTWDSGGGTWSVYTPPVTSYSVTLALTNLTGSNTADTVEEGAAYTTTLKAAAAYALPQSVSVTVGGTALTGGYSYSSETGELTIDGASVTGDIVITAAADAYTYLKPNANWLIDGARFAVYYWDNSGSHWLDMTDADGDGYYEVVVPAGYSNVIFCRMNPGASTNEWNNKWNQTSDLTLPTDGSNCYTVADGTWDNGGGTWSVYTPAVEEEPTQPTEPEETAVDYYLIGYINGADYGCNDDWQNLGEYKFVDGKLTVTFTADSYVFVKTGDNANWYLAESYCTDTTVTLKKDLAEKMFVPGNVELTFTLVENADGTLTLSYEKTEQPEETAAAYYLVGYINGADLGIAADSANLGSYKFVDGKLTVTFTSDSYVVVKNSEGTQYWSEIYSTDTSVTLKQGGSEKLFVPGGKELSFTLVENADGTLTLSYTVAVEVPAVPEGYNTVTVHYLKPGTWGSTVNAWVWDASGAIPGYELYQTAWPGSPIPANAEKAGWYDLVIGTAEPQAFNFIFNDGSNQTADLTTGAVTGPTELWVVDGVVYTSAPLEWTHYTATIHFQKPGSWGSTINAYAWNDGGKLLGDWPGTVTSPSVNEGWYTALIHVEIGQNLNFIFNDGSNQTADLTAGQVTGNIELWIDDSGNAVSAPDGWIDAARTVHVPGTFPGPSWDPASNQMTYDPELGLYVITFEDVPAASYMYKIAINGSWGENYGANGEAGGNDIRVTVPVAQDVTIWYNDVTHMTVNSVTYEMNADIRLTGTGIPAGTKLTDPRLTGLYSVTVPLSAGTYEDLTITYGDFSTTFGPFTLTADKEVTFYFDPATYLASHDGSDVKVETGKIFYDSKDESYKSPFGAVAAGEKVTYAIDTGVDATGVSLIVPGQKPVAMTKDGAAVDGVQRWTCTTSFDSLGEYQYYFAISNGSDLVFYTDDNYNNYYKKGDYGTGTVRDQFNLFPYDQVVYEAGYETPDWMKNAVIYQIFPDRFFDGDVSNNRAQETARGEVDYEIIENWYLWPENPEMSGEDDYPIYAWKGDGEWSNEMYGGDLKGITEKIGYLKALGVNVIYLNPVFSSISNHRYDACDYMEIDPILGTLGDFEELVAVAEANDMHIILDGVFNHVSDDSVYFDRYYKFLGTSEKIGAYPYWAYVYDYMAEQGADQAAAETAAKEFFSANYGITDWSYTEWFAVQNVTGTAVDNIGLRAGKPVYSYEGWWGYDSMPVVKSTNGSEYQTGNWAEEIISNSDNSSVTQYWITKGNNGWRLDVANEVSDETWQHFRDSVKALDSDAVIIGEIWADSTHYLMGDMYDSVMNYVFRDAVAGFARGYLINRDNKAEMWDSDFTAADAITVLEILRERYPEEAFYAMMNLVASHDTSRILSYLDDLEDDRYQKDMAHAFPTYETTSDRAKQLQYVVAFVQFTYAGAPTIYYGDEIGMVGGDDPDDRRAFTWGQGNQDIVEWYATLAAVREQYPALRTGSVEAFAPDTEVMGYVRRDSADTLIVLANRSASAKTVKLDLRELNVTADALTELLSGTSYTVSGNTVEVTVPAYRGVILTANAKSYSVDTEALKPAYDAAYTVPNRHVHSASGEGTVVAPTCTESGYTEHLCKVCGETYQADIVAAKGHSLTKVDANAPTCTVDGTIEHYVCGVCGKLFADAEGESEITDIVAPAGHTLTKVDAMAPTPSKDGCIEHYICSVCGKLYADAEGKTGLTAEDVVIPATGSEIDPSEPVDKPTDGAPETGESYFVGTFGTLLTVSAAALLVLLTLKRKLIQK